MFMIVDCKGTLVIHHPVQISSDQWHLLSTIYLNSTNNMYNTCLKHSIVFDKINHTLVNKLMGSVCRV